MRALEVAKRDAEVEKQKREAEKQKREEAEKKEEVAKKDAEVAREEARKRREEARKEKGPIVCAAEDFSEKEGLNYTQTESVKDIARGLKNNQIDDPNDLMHLSYDGIKILLDEDDEFTAQQKQFLSSLKVNQPYKVKKPVRLLGWGYDLINDTSTLRDIFDMECQETKFGVMVPNFAEIGKVDRIREFVELHPNREEMVGARTRELGLALKVNPNKYVGSTKRPGFTLNTSKEYSLLHEHRVFEVHIENTWRDCPVSGAFVEDVKNLPSSSLDVLGKHTAVYEDFFNKWGHCVVTRVYGGGSYEAKADMTKDRFCSRTAKQLFYNLSPHSEQYEIEQTFSNIIFNGGEEHLHNINKLKQWSLSIIEKPEILSTEMSCVPISDVVGMLVPKKQEACAKALKDIVGKLMIYEEKTNFCLEGIQFLNQTDYTISDISVTSGISYKTSLLQMKTMDITKEDPKGKLWRNRETVKFEHEILDHESGTLSCNLKIDETRRHYWMIGCKIDGAPYKFEKTNAEIRMYLIDKQSTPTFTFRGDPYRNNNLSVQMRFNSGRALFRLIPDREVERRQSVPPEDVDQPENSDNFM